jgi:hypothetical protein
LALVASVREATRVTSADLIIFVFREGVSIELEKYTIRGGVVNRVGKKRLNFLL